MAYDNDFPLDTYPAYHSFKDPSVSRAAVRDCDTLLRYRGVYNSDQPFITELGVVNGTVQGQSLTYAQTNHLIDVISKAWTSSIGILAEGKKGRKTVGILGRNGTEFVLTELALIRLGHVPILISAAMAPTSISSILSSQNASYLLYGPEYRSLANAVAEQDLTRDIESSPWASIPSLPIPNNPTSVDIPDTSFIQPTDTAFTVHTSGSTGFPKAISISHRSMISFGAIWGCTGSSFIMTPLSHGYSQMGLFHAIQTGGSITIFPPTQPLTGPNLVNSLQHIDKARTTLYAVPIALKMLTEEPSAFETLRQLYRVISCGAPCPKPLGDQLVAENVRLVAGLASSDALAMMTSERDFDNDKEWEYHRIHPTLIEPHIKFEPLGDGTHQLIYLPTWPTLNLRNLPDGGCATGDVLQKHPSRPNLWKWVRRTDDIIVHVNGTKTWPIPIEAAIKSEPRIKDALVVGSEKSNTGVLIIPQSTETTQSISGAALIELVQKANKDLPAYSVIVPELVKVLTSDSTFVLAPKGSIVRKATLAKYNGEIEKMYAEYAAGSSLNTETITLKDLPSALDLVRTELIQTMPKLGNSLNLDKSTFDQGVNSLAALRVRNSLQRQLNFDPPLTGNVVYELETPTQLAEYVFNRQSAGASSDINIPVKSELDRTQSLLASAKKRVDETVGATIRQSSQVGGKEEVILLTGATGVIGSHVLSAIAKNGSARRIICLVRASSDAEATKRVDESLYARQLPSLDTIGKLTPVQTVAQTEGTLASLSTVGITSIIHLAWPVNFNLPVNTFTSAIDLLVDLIALAVNSGASLHFASSVSAYVHGASPIPDTIAPDPSLVADAGYSRSKWISENLLEYASKTGGLRGNILRIGQITGDTINGIWNDTEAIPLLIQSVRHSGVLPDRSVEGHSPHWLPVDTLASAIARLVVGPTSKNVAVYNLWNHNSTSWNTVLNGVKRSGVDFEVVSYDEWLRKLAEMDVDRVPAAKLLDYYTQGSKDSGVFDQVVYDTSATSELLSPADWDPKGLTEEDVVRMVRHWDLTR